MGMDKLAMKTGQVNYLRKGDPGEPGAPGAPGEQGPRGPMVYPAGLWDGSATYTRTALSTPMVLHEGQYYVLGKEGSFTGINPQTDYAAHGNDATWLLMDKAQYVFAEVLMADFARLASAVFHGRYMFSQYGTDADGQPVETASGYKDFNASAPMDGANAFRPNLLLDFLTGDLRTRIMHLRISNNGADAGENGSIRIGPNLGLLPELEHGECRQILWIVPQMTRVTVDAVVAGASANVKIGLNGDFYGGKSSWEMHNMGAASFLLIGFNNSTWIEETDWAVYPMNSASETVLDNAI